MIYIINNVIDFLNRYNSFAIVSHVDPDGDTIGSALALCIVLKKLGKNVALHCKSIIPNFYSFLSYSNEYQDISEIDDKVEAIISVDCADFSRTFLTKDQIQGKHTLNIDHHISNDSYFELNIIDTTACATCELMYSIISQIPDVMCEDVAKCIYTGISTDTSNFTNSSVSPKAFEIMNEISKYDIKIHELAKILFRTNSIAKTNAICRIINNWHLLSNDRLVISYFTFDEIEELNLKPYEMEGLIDYLCNLENISVAVFAREFKKGIYKVSMRSNYDVNVSEVCKKFGGGGHIKAAGCIMKGDLEEVVNNIIGAFAEIL